MGIMMQSTIEKQRKTLLKKFHALLAEAGMTEDDKMLLLAAYGVESSRDLTFYELIEACNTVENKANPALAERARWRRRVMAAVAEYLRLMGKRTDGAMVRGTICRAAGTDDFYSICTDRLRSLYNAFVKRNRDLRTVADDKLMLD